MGKSVKDQIRSPEMESVSVIFDEFRQADEPKERKEVLARYKGNNSLKWILKGTFDPEVEYCTTTIPSWKPDPAPLGLNPSNLFLELKRIYVVLDGDKRSAQMERAKRAKVFVQMLESLHPSEAEILANMVLKDQQIEGLNLKLVKQVFPKLIVKPKE